MTISTQISPRTEITKAIDQNRNRLLASIVGIYKAEECGICENIGAEIFWFSTTSTGAHSVCREKIRNIEAELIAKIKTLFDDNYDRNMAHVRAIKSIKEKLNGASIKTFLEIEGADKLKSIFDSYSPTVPAKL